MDRSIVQMAFVVLAWHIFAAFIVCNDDPSIHNHYHLYPEQYMHIGGGPGWLNELGSWIT
jgi:hypothetical protein